MAVEFTVPFVGEISGTWRPDDAERKAAWELYVELITRVSVIELGPAEGVLREALSSHYTLSLDHLGHQISAGGGVGSGEPRSPGSEEPA
ncbi:hypothetical protein ACWC9R_21125 [Streptomyces sp. NPDC001219]